MKKEFKDIYENLEKRIPCTEKLEYSSLVNFSENLKIPRHRWFNIKEGYSIQIVEDLIRRFGCKDEEVIFDPFSGSGTTLLASKQLGVNSFGFEINPFFVFLIKNKLIDVKVHLSKYIDSIKALKDQDDLSPPKLSISEKLFGKQFNTVLTLKKYLTELKPSPEKNLLKLAFLCSLEKSSIAKKDGNGLKYPKTKIPTDIKEEFIRNILLFEKDLSSSILNKKNKAEIFRGDVRELKETINSNKRIRKYEEKVSLSIFSPPYMNCFDYTEVYKVELWFGDFIKEYSDLKILRNNSLDSHLSKSFKKEKQLNNQYVNFFVEFLEREELWSKKIPFMIKGYFEDMSKVLEGIYKLLKKGGKCIIIVGNSAYGNKVIPTDLILGDIGLNLGFKKCNIEIARHLGTSPQQYKKVNTPELLRESLIILEK